MNRCLIGFLGCFLALTACTAPTSTSSSIHVENAWARPALAGPMSTVTGTPDMPGMSGMSANDATSAVYFVIINDTNEADTLTGVVSDAARQAAMHQTIIEDGIAEMVPVTSVNIPAHGRFEFTPGGYHVMLDGLIRDLNVGETLNLTLIFAKRDAITLRIPVRQEK